MKKKYNISGHKSDKSLWIFLLAIILGITLMNSNSAVSRDEGFIVNMKVSISGYYDIHKAEMIYSDVVTASLRSAEPPYRFIDKADALIDNLTLTGKFNFTFKPEKRFYIVINHRNSLEVWSRIGGEEVPEGNSMDYDFTNSKDKTFGEVLECSGKHFCLWSGDVNQDGTIDGTDFSFIENAVFGFETGYIPTDLNGDEVVDGDDFMIMETYQYFYQIVTPETGLRPYKFEKDLSLMSKTKKEQTGLKNYPNPFNPSTVISFSMNSQSKVRVVVYDITGRQAAVLADGIFTAGNHNINWNASGFPSGTYICLLTSNGIIEKKVMNLIK